jgi:hypothetical protein
MADECVQDFFQHEVDEGTAVAEIGTPVDGTVIGFLFGNCIVNKDSPVTCKLV